MSVNAALQSQISSIQQAVNLSALQKSMNQDGAAVTKLLEGMQENTEMIQEAAAPGKGNFINIKA
jgi:hypothetical protein